LGPEHAFLSGPGGGPLQDLGTLGGTSSSATAVNDSGQVVGYSLIASVAVHAFLYSGGQMLDLNSLVAPGSGFTLVQANGISDTGYITGYGTAPDGQTHAFLLTPVTAVPEPSGLVLLGADPRRDTRAVRPGAAGDRDRRPAGLLHGAAAGPAPRLTPRGQSPMVRPPAPHQAET
jgi:probable HAF family extracellular repeat protein